MAPWTDGLLDCWSDQVLRSADVRSERGDSDPQLRAAMGLALELGASARTRSSPNPWVGAVVVAANGAVVGSGATEPAGGAHAEVSALRRAGPLGRGATLVVTLEPCAHHGRTPPCVAAIIAAGIARVVVAVVDPDPCVAGRGVAALRAAGIDVTVGLMAEEAATQLHAYLHHRTTGRPYVVCKLATTVDGAIAAADGRSQWITGLPARIDAHRLRAESDAIVVGAGTVRADDPALTVRHVAGRDPLRVVLGEVPDAARVHPCMAWHDDVTGLTDELGRRGVLQALVEGGARTVRSFLDAGLIDRFVLYVAPRLMTGRDVVPLIAGPTSASIDEAWSGHFVGMRRVGDDLRIDLVPPERGQRRATPPGSTTDREE